MRRRKKHVRLHLEGAQPSVQGIFVGFWAGHYVLHVPELVENADRSIALDGNVKVPRSRVLFMQEL